MPGNRRLCNIGESPCRGFDLDQTLAAGLATRVGPAQFRYLGAIACANNLSNEQQ